MNKLGNSIQDLDIVNMSNVDENAEHFIVKRSELSDILFFKEHFNGREDSLKKVFGDFDPEIIFETSLFSITIVDNKINSLAGIFIFNDTPFGVLRREGWPNLGGNWENWFSQNFDNNTNNTFNSQNTLFLIYFNILDNYCNNEEISKKIFHKIYLSLYTTLSSINSVLFLLKKKHNQQLLYDDETEDGKGNVINHYIKFMLNYIYKVIPGISSEDFINDQNQVEFTIFHTKRNTVFPLIEIRIASQEDHDDLENIFKDQTSMEVAGQFAIEEFFIAKMIANQNNEEKVLVGQVLDKAIGMLSISTDVDIKKITESFDLEAYDNLLKPDYMKAVKLKKKIMKENSDMKEKIERQEILRKFKEEVMSCERISQRVVLQEYLRMESKQEFYGFLEEIEKNVAKKLLNTEYAQNLINALIDTFEIKNPNLEQFEGKIKIDEGSCLLTEKVKFFLETLEFFGLPKGYMNREGHFGDWSKKEEAKRLAKEEYKRSLKQNKNTSIKPINRKAKEGEEAAKPTHFDFDPLSKSLRALTSANIQARTTLRQLFIEQKKLISSFFVNVVNGEEEPSELRCFDINNLGRKLLENGIDIAVELCEIIGPMLMCFGNLEYDKLQVMKVPEPDLYSLNPKKDEKKTKKSQAKKKEKEEEEVAKVRSSKKPELCTLYNISISEFWKSLEISFNYDKLLYEMKVISNPDFTKEYNEYMTNQEKNKNKIQNNKSDYETLKNNMLGENIKEAQEKLTQYEDLLKSYDNEKAVIPTNSSVINAFCVNLFFIEQAFESRSADFLIQAFDLFPNKDYLVIFQPHSYYENNLLEPFIKVEKKLDPLFEDLLYILHRESLMISLLNVNYATKENLYNSTFLFENLKDAKEENRLFQIAYESILNKTTKFSTICAKINESIIGLFIVSKEVNISYYESHFTVRDFSDIDKISKYSQGRILFFSMHKNFQQHTKLILKEILRLTNKITLYYELMPDVIAPSFIKELLIIRNRRFPHFIMKKWNYERGLFEDDKIKSRTDGEERDELDEEESNFCLTMVTKKMLSDSKIANNNRIVVVGASDTGISFIESLLSIRYLDFSHIYLIAPGGLLYHHINDDTMNLKVSTSNYQIPELKKTLLENRIKIINEKVVNLNRNSKYIELSDKSIITYDYLILTLGLQDKLKQEMTKIITENINKEYEPLKDQQVGNLKETQNLNNQISSLMMQPKIYSVDDPNIYSIFAPGTKLINSLKKNPKEKIILYGRNLNLLCFIQGLIKRKVPPHKIKLIIPNLYEHVVKDEKVKKEGYSEELNFINSNTLEQTPELEKYLLSMYAKLGVEILQNFNFKAVNINQENSTIASYRFCEEGKESDSFQDLPPANIVTGGLIDVDPLVFNFIHDNGLVYNGRMIIDRNFRTADNNIFAAGRLCEFSHKYEHQEKGKLLKLER